MVARLIRRAFWDSLCTQSFRRSFRNISLYNCKWGMKPSDGIVMTRSSLQQNVQCIRSNVIVGYGALLAVERACYCIASNDPYNSFHFFFQFHLIQLYFCRKIFSQMH